MKKSDREKLKKMTLVEFKQKYPKVVESIRHQEREKLYPTIEKNKQRIKELKEQIKEKIEARQELTESLKKKKKGLNETYNTLLARKAELILKEQDYEHKALIKKKLKNMPNSLKAILIPVLSSLSSSEAMDKEIEKTMKLYQATHPGEPQAGILEGKHGWSEKVTEEEKKAILDEQFRKAFE